MPITLESFLEVVRRSELVDLEILSRALADFRAQVASEPDARSFAEYLCRKELLTIWQATKLLAGKHRGYLLGRYRLLSLLGKGGMSSVYLAEHTVMKRRCAVKVLPTQKSKSKAYLNRFHREARAVAALDDPNIVRAYDIDQAQDGTLEIHFLVMEYVAGKTLFEVVRAQGPLPVPKAVNYIRQAASGLAHAHASGLIHRDVKPENLIVDKNGVVKVMDLGLARFFENEDEQLTVHQDERVLGTANYCSPEQAVDSHHVDARTDIYSLGCTFYYLLMGHPPFNTGTLAQRLMAHQTRQPPLIEAKRPDVPNQLIQLIRRMMAKSPDERFQTANDVLNALDAFTAPSPLQVTLPAPPPSDGETAEIVIPSDEILAGPIAEQVSLPPLGTITREQVDEETDSNALGDGSPTEPTTAERFFLELSDPESASDSTVLSLGKDAREPVVKSGRNERATASSETPRKSAPDTPAVARKPSSDSSSQKHRRIVIAGIALAAILGGIWLASLFWPQGTRRTALTGTEREILVGPGGNFGSIGEAIDAVRTTARQVRTIKVEAGYAGDEQIVINGKQRFPRGLRIVGQGTPRPVLRPSKPEEPILSLIDVEGLTIEGLDFDASASDVAIRLSGFLINSKLNDLTITGYQSAGIEAQGLNGYPEQEFVIASTTFRGEADSVGVRLKAIAGIRTAEVKFQNQRMIGPMAAGIEIIGGLWNTTVERSIFLQTNSGVRFAQSNQDIHGVSIVQNTFSSCEHGVSFAGQPASDSSAITLARNLFVKQQGPEMTVETGLTPELAVQMAPSNGETSHNWSDRDAPSEPRSEAINIFLNAGQRGITSPRFSSTDPQKKDFFRPSSDVRFQSDDGEDGFVGAVAP